MSDPFNEFNMTPTLVFDDMPIIEEEKKEVVEVSEEKPKPLDDSMLNDDEKAMVDRFVQQIDLTNTNAVLHYGAGVQKKMADFSETALENVRSKDLGEVGDMLSNATA